MAALRPRALLTVAALVVLAWPCGGFALALAALAGTLQSYEKLAPFAAIRWQGEEAEVEVAGRWYRLRAIDGRSTAELLAFCQSRYDAKAFKRFEEDLVQVLTELGQPPDRTVDLALTELDTRRDVELREVPLTAENRAAILAAANAREETAPAGLPGVPVARVRRAHAAASAEGYEALARWPALAAGHSIPRAAAAEDLGQLEWLMRERFAYRDPAGVDLAAAFDALHLGLPEEVDLFAFALQLRRLLACFGDGHSRLDALPDLPRALYLPCLIENVGERLYALEPDRSAFLDANFPCLAAIDGLESERWLAAAAALEAGGHPGAVRRRAVRTLRDLTILRGELGLAAESEVRLTLTDAAGKRRRELVLAAATRRPSYGQRVSGEHRMLGGKVGYLRLPQMTDEPEFLDGLDRAMAGFAKTKGLVIDVRGNGGGSRDALLRLAPYFLAPSEPCFVANVAAYRLAPGEPRDAAEGYLEDRFLFPRTSRRLDQAAGRAIDALAGFRPEWEPPPSEFSAWHYLVLSRAANPKAFAYEKPVIVLLDADCFSATDIFLSALAEFPQVTLMGQTSGGGSGRALSYRLVHSGLEVRLSSMASFRVDGRRIDGRGIEPDIEFWPAPDDLLGRGDALLDEAVRNLR